MTLWIDDVRPAPEGYTWCKSVNEAKEKIIKNENRIKEMGAECRRLDSIGNYYDADCLHMVAANTMLHLIDIDHDAGDYASDGGDYIKLLDWLEETGRNYPIHIHSMNTVGVANMRAIIERNGWKEIR
jgi:hypothetical protein